MAKPTTKQKLAFANLIKALQTGDAFNMDKIMIDAGYTKATAKNPALNLTDKNGWKQLLKNIDDEVLLNKLYKMVKEDKDKRVVLASIQEIFKLKDKYPAGKLKVSQYEGSLKDLE